MLQLTGVSKTYGLGAHALDPTDLSVQPGQVTVLLGPSGAGHVIDLFDSEIRMALGQLGCADCSAAGRLELAVQV